MKLAVAVPPVKSRSGHHHAAMIYIAAEKGCTAVVCSTAGLPISHCTASLFGGSGCAELHEAGLLVSPMCRQVGSSLWQCRVVQLVRLMHQGWFEQCDK
jgi:hypothetical protein